MSLLQNGFGGTAHSGLPLLLFCADVLRPQPRPFGAVPLCRLRAYRFKKSLRLIFLIFPAARR
ncbi:MAG: hypothetical protein VB021_05315 [Oscillospiraceae bacterium]|nr:hypothetical protein [Oscillospiraceae bacterium]